MANVLTDFTQKNIAELILGLAVGVIVVLLMNLNFNQSIAIIILSPLIAIILNNLLQVFIPNTKNQRTALIILALIGGFMILQQFQIGVFDLSNTNTQSFVNVPLQSQTIIELPIAVTGALVGALGKLPFLVLFTLIVAGLLVSPFAWVGWVILAIIGIPALFILGAGTIAIFQNFQLILILATLYGVASLMFKAKIAKRS